MNDLTKAQKNKEKLYAGSTKEQQILATTKGKKSYVYQNMLLTQETKNLKEQNKQRQTALKETRDSYMKAKSKYDTADADKTKSQNKLLKNKTVMSKLNKTQQKALKAGKTVAMQEKMLASIRCLLLNLNLVFVMFRYQMRQGMHLWNKCRIRLKWIRKQRLK